MLKAVRTVAPAGLVVSIEQVRRHLNIDTDEYDELIEGYIETATDHLEGPRGVSGLAFLTQTWRLDVSAFDDPWSSTPVYLAPLPVQSIMGVTYYDGIGSPQTLPTSVYRFFNGALGPYLALKPDQDWPSVYDREDAISITFVAGYGDNPRDVPASIRHAILLLVGHWYENREAVSVGDSASELPFAVKALIQPSRPLAI